MEFDQFKSSPTEDELDMEMEIEMMMSMIQTENKIISDFLPTESPTNYIPSLPATNLPIIDNKFPFSTTSTTTAPAVTASTTTTMLSYDKIQIQIPSESRSSFYSDHRSHNPIQQKRNSMAAMREMIFRMAAMQPIHIDPESVKAPKRRNVKISNDPQSVAARHRRERISEKIRILQRLVPGGTKMDTASMLDEAIHYVKFLKTQIQSLERVGVDSNNSNKSTSSSNFITSCGVGFPVPVSNGYRSYLPLMTEKSYRQMSPPPSQNGQSFD